MLPFAIIGCGEAAQQHASAIAQAPIAVCDTDRDRADRFAEQYRSKAYYDIEDILDQKDIDVLLVCTPNGLHAEHCIRALQAGKHVVCEAPFCLTAAAAWQMIETEKFCRKKLFVVQRARLLPELRQLRQKLEQNPYLMNDFELVCADTPVQGWRQQQFPGGGLLYTAGHEAMDVLCWLLGSLDSVQDVQMKSGQGEIEAGGRASVQMSGGQAGVVIWGTEAKGREPGLYTASGGFFPAATAHAHERLKGWYDGLGSMLAGASNIYEAMRTVTAIEKIYQSHSKSSSAA